MRKLINRISKSKRFEYFLLILILLAGFAVRLYKINSPIADWHSWRQVDTASVARIYVDEGIELMRPRYYDISSIQTGFYNPEGYRFVEFPIYNVIHALSYETFPKISFEAWGRLISIFASLITTLLLYFLGKRLIGKSGGLFAAFYFAFIPFNVYFSRVILPEPMAAMFAVLSVWLFVRFIDTEKNYYAYISAAAFALSILIKPYTVFYAVAIAYMAIKKYGIKGIFKNIPLLIALDIALVPFLLWRAWINTGMHFLGVPHLQWAFNGDGIRFKPSFWRWIFYERIGNLILGGWGLIPFGVGILKRSKKLMIIEFLAIGMIMYLAIVASANVRHDYYQTFIIPVIALILAKGSLDLWTSEKKIRLRSRGLLIFSICMMLLVGTYQVREFFKVNHPEFIEVGRIVDESTPKDSLVIVPDNGNTVFLYHTKRKGWPVLEGNIDDFVKLGADYFVSVNNDADTNMMKNKFEVFKQGTNYWIIDLNKPKK